MTAGSPRSLLKSPIRGPRSWGIAVALCGAVAAAALPSSACAAGNESQRRAYDLALTVDSRWAGGANGGYYPIRIRLTNMTRPRQLLFRFVDTSSDESKLPTVERQILVDQNATQQFTLSIPLVSYNSNGELRVYENGRLLEQFSQHVSLPAAYGNTVDRPALLVIHPSPATVDCNRFEEAIQSLIAGTPSTPGGMVRSAGMGWTGYPSGGSTNDFQVLAPALLPESWIDYTALDIVAVPVATFGKLPAAVRNALIQWTEAGGTLLLTEVGEPAATSKELSQLLDLARRPAASQVWHPAQPALHRPIVAVIDPSAPTGGTVVPTGPGGTPAVVTPEQQEITKRANESKWKVTDEAFSHCDLLAGHVYAFRENPFPGAPVDWAWWLNSANWSNTLKWTARFGNSTRERHPGFFEFLIPGVGAVPVIAFVLLISLFAVVIGPVNYFIVLRRKQLYLLVLTIPTIAFLTSCALFAYAMIADGFRTQSRLMSFTLLDQGTKHAVSFNRISLFAGLAPSHGLQFSPDTAVLPIWSSDVCFEGGTVDWTDTQALTTGWLRSRTRTQFETIEHRIERGRLEFSSAAGGTPPEASNGLEWTIDTLIVKDESGQIYSGRNLPAGASLKLHPLDPSDVRALGAALNEFPLQAPPGAVNDPSPFNPRSRRSWVYGYGVASPISFSQSLLQRGVERLSWSEKNVANGLAPRSYLVTFRENPGIELGVERTVPKAGVHLLLGYY